MTIKLIIGLANPGAEYATTRHNIGSWYVDLLAERLCAPPFCKEPWFYGFTSRISLSDVDVHLMIPTTFMNLSGKAVVAIKEFYHINSNEILVAHDELNLPPGVVSFRFGGTHGGHNGLRNIIDQLKNNQDFYRLRIGIGHPGDRSKVTDFVLSSPHTTEQKNIYKAIDKAIRYTENWLYRHSTKAVDQLHTIKI